MFKRLISESNSKWKCLTWRLLNNNNQILTKNINMEILKKPMTDYHTQLLSSWSKLKNREPVTVNEILNEYLCDNSFIPLESIIKKKLSFNKKVNDILNNDRQFYSVAELNDKYKCTLNFLEYRSIITAIPNHWKIKINKNINVKFEEIKDFSVKIKCRHKLVTLTKQKEIYWELINREKTQIPTAVFTWHDLFPFLENVNWSYFRMLPYRIVREPYIQTFQYKILNRTL